jgi:hypothetical protein
MESFLKNVMNSLVNELMIIVNNDNSSAKIENKAIRLFHKPPKKIRGDTQTDSKEIS